MSPFTFLSQQLDMPEWLVVFWLAGVCLLAYNLIKNNG